MEKWKTCDIYCNTLYKLLQLINYLDKGILALYNVHILTRILKDTNSRDNLELFRRDETSFLMFIWTKSSI